MYISCLESVLAPGFLYTSKKRSLGLLLHPSKKKFVLAAAFSHGERHHVWLTVVPKASLLDSKVPVESGIVN